ncbi:cation transport regulator ChaB [Actinomadura soli]|uniref:Cation transport regulator ChaB n=1 Tax=Actinomadura soli TaxID=2508997 RepID=A0A5C4J7U7_9ACTN|nr:ChaB family protein [Actinomadura soli]TMQ94759.1 cation transport regulator ChaB [Actinomadura soli]
MPMMTRSGKLRMQELPSTLQRSPKEAQETFAKAHDSAVETYGEGERAHRTAYAALKRRWEKHGDRWIRKAGRGPSDERAKSPRARRDHGRTFGGVDVEGNTKKELYDRAADLDVHGRSKMTKEELAKAIARKRG